MIGSLLIPVHMLMVCLLQVGLGLLFLIPLAVLLDGTLGRIWPARWLAAFWKVLLVWMLAPILLVTLSGLGLSRTKTPGVILPQLPLPWLSWSPPKPPVLGNPQAPLAPVEARVLRPLVPLMHGPILALVEVGCLVSWLVAAGLGVRRHRAWLRQVRRAEVVTSPAAWEELERLRAELGLRSTVLLMESDAVRCPVVTVVGLPAIVFPTGLTQRLAPLALGHVLAHELVHLQRKDLHWMKVMSLLRGLYWFHPLVPWALGRAWRAQEAACDEAVIHQLEPDVRAYGHTLLDLAKAVPLGSCHPGALGGGASGLRRRVQGLLNLLEPIPRRRYAQAGAFTLLLALACLWGGPVPSIPFRRWPGPVANTFTDDPSLHGTWVVVDYVHSPATFRPGTRQWPQMELWVQRLSFLQDGRLDAKPVIGHTWTKGGVLDGQQAMAYPLEVRRVDGQDYLFMAWQCGDVVIWGGAPSYYVFRRA